MNNEVQPMLRPKDVAEMLGVALGTVYAWVSRKKIPHHRISPRLVLFKRKDIIRWVNNGRCGPAIQKENSRAE